MGYRNRVQTIDFDDLGDGCHVVIRNPKLLPPDELRPSFEVEMVPRAENPTQMVPLDDEKATLAAQEVLGKLIVSWVVWDVNDDSDDPAVLPLPKDDPTVMDRLPIEIIKRLSEELTEAVNPQ